MEFLAVALLVVASLLALAQMAVWVWARGVAVSARTKARAPRPRPVVRSTTAGRTRSVLHDGLGGRRPGFRVEAARTATPSSWYVAGQRAGDRPVPAPVHGRGRAPGPGRGRPAVSGSSREPGRGRERGRGVRRARRGALGVLVEVVVLFGTLQRATLATSAAAPSTGAGVVLSDSVDDAAARTALVLGQAEANHGLRTDSSHARRSAGAGGGPRSAFGGDRGPGAADPVHRTGVALALGSRRVDARRAGRPLPELPVNERGQASVFLVGVVLLGLAFTGLAVDGTRLFTARPPQPRRLRRARRRLGDRRGPVPGHRRRRGAARSRGAHLAIDEIVRASSLPVDTTVDVQVAG